MASVVLADPVLSPPGEMTGDQPAGKRLIDRLGRRTVQVLTCIGFGLPVLSYLWLIEHYGVNVIEGDQWDDVTVIRASHVHLFSWGAMWAQHNENRIFFPNLLVVLMSRTTHFNIVFEEYLGAAMLVGAATLILLTHKRRSPDTPWLYYCPAVFLIFSFSQFGNALWGFQMAWFLVLLSFATALYLLDRLELGSIAYCGAFVAAIIGSFSSLQGLLIWPVGLFLLYHRRRSWLMAIVWVVGGVASTILYFYNFNQSSLGDLAVKHPIASIKFFLFALGDVLGFQIQLHKPPAVGIIVFGIILFALAVMAIALYGIRRDEHGAGPVGVALIVMGFLFAATVTEGRLIFGYWAAGASRYTTFDVLVPVGIYFAFLTNVRQSAGVAAVGLPDEESAPSNSLSAVPGRWAWFNQIGLPVIRAVVIVLIVIQIAFSVPSAIKGARANYVYQAKGAEILENINHSSDGPVIYYLAIFDKAPFIRRQARTLEKYHLSVFADQGSSP